MSPKLSDPFLETILRAVDIQFKSTTLSRNSPKRADPLSVPSWSRLVLVQPFAASFVHVQDPNERLGTEDGALGVKQHPYFANTDWDLLEQVWIQMLSFLKWHSSLFREK